MAPGQDWIITDIDDDAVSAAEAASQAAALSVDEWIRRAIVETYRREALTPPAKAVDSTASTASETRPEAPPEPSPEAATEPESEASPRPTPQPSPDQTPAPSPKAPTEPPAAASGPPAQPYQPISPGTARVIRTGRLAVGVLLVLVAGAVAWNSLELWRGGDEAPATTAEPELVTLPTEQVPVRPAHETPDPRETERVFAERQAAAEPDTAPNEAPIVDEAPAGEDEAASDEATPAATEETAAPEETETAETSDPGAAEAPTAVGAEPVTDPAAVPESEAAVPGAATEVAAADPFAADPFDTERVPESGTVSPMKMPAEPAAAIQASPAETAGEGQVATRTPTRSTPVDDVPESVAAFVEAAEAGDPDAQHDLALIYIQGLGVPRDPEAAAHWFGEAAQQGNANAQYNLGVMYEQGLGVPQDRIEALLLYLTAAEQGHVAAQYNAGLAYAEGNNIPRDFAEAHRWFSAAAEQGLAEAQYNLGIIYENGLGRAKDDIVAYRHYSQATQSGHQEAARKLKTVSARLSPAQRVEAEQAVAAEPPPPATEENSMARLDHAGIREVQQLLKILGFDTGTPDGLSGGRTTTAIREYQQSVGLLVDGKPTTALLEQLRHAAEQ